jgi:hypothetical protein
MTHESGLIIPIRGAFQQTQLPGDSRKAVTGCPAHNGGKRMYPGAPTQFPKSGIRLVIAESGLLAYWFEFFEQSLVTAPRQALIEKNMGGGENGGTVNIMLDLTVGQIAYPHRPHPPVTGERVFFAFAKICPTIDAIYGL